MRPTAGQPDWYKFDDSKVSHATESDAIDDNFGGDEITEMKIGKDAENTRFATEKHSSAYMLVYVRRPDIGMVFSDTTLPEEEEFLAKMNEELARIKLEEKQLEEMRQYCQVRVYTADESGLCVNPIESLDMDNNDINSPRGAGFQTYNYSRNAALPLFDSRKSRLVSIKKEALMKSLKVEIEKQLGIPVSRQRLWTLRDLSVTGLRLERPLSVEYMNHTVTQYKSVARSYAFSTNLYSDDDAEFEIFVEVNDDIPLEPTHVQPHLRDEEPVAPSVPVVTSAAQGKAPAGNSPAAGFGLVAPLVDIAAEYGLGLVDQPRTKPLGHALGESRNFDFDDYSTFESQAQSAGPNQKGFPSLDETKLIFVRYFDPRDSSFSLLGQIYFPDGGSLELLEDAVIPLLAKREIPQKREEYLQSLLKNEKPTHHPHSDDNSSSDGYDLDELLFFYSDANFAMTDALDMDSLRNHNSTHGAWVTVQYVVRSGEHVPFKNAKACLIWHKSRINFSFIDISHLQLREPPVLALPFTGETQVHEIWTALGAHLNWPANQIAISPSYAGTARPMSNATIFDGTVQIQRAFAASLYRATYSAVPIFYEKLDVPLIDTKAKVSVKAVFVDRFVNPTQLSFFLPDPPIASDLSEAALAHPKVLERLNKSHAELRIFEFDDKRAYYRDKHGSESLNQYTIYGIEEVLPEEHARDKFSIIVFMIHVSASAMYTRPTHLPFTIVVDPTETVRDVKRRILQKIGRLEEEESAQNAQIANVDCWVRDPAFSATMPCHDDATFDDSSIEDIYIHIRAPTPEPERNQNSAANAPAQAGAAGAGAGANAEGNNGTEQTKPTTTTKEKPRNMLHLGD